MTCDADCTAPACGDGFLNPVLGEVCDDGNTSNGDGCSSDCRRFERCGDGNRQGAEECDSGGINTNTCDANCTFPACGDNFTNPAFNPPGPINAEQCDVDTNNDGVAEDVATCDSDCSLPACRDGHVNPSFDPDGAGPATGEQCDDNNAVNTDDCVNTCQFNVCGDGFRDQQGPVTEACDTAGNSQTCDADCTAPSCGDGFTNPNFDPDGAGPRPPEQCDTSGDTAACDSDCTTPSCGDGHVNPNFDPDGAGPAAREECDPPNGITCTATCQNI